MFWHQSRMVSISVTRCLMNIRSCSVMPRNRAWNSFSSSRRSGRRVAFVPSLSAAVLGNFWSSSSMLNDMLPFSLIKICLTRPKTQGSIRSWRFAGDAVGVVPQPFVYARRIETPARRQQRDFCDVGRRPFRRRPRSGIRMFTVTKAFHAEFRLGGGFAALIPHGFARPRIRAHHHAVFHANPGVMIQNPFHLEELHVTEFAAESGQKIKTLIHVTAWIRQAGTGDNDPAVDRRTDEKPVPARHPFRPGAGRKMSQAQRGLDGFGRSEEH